MDSKTEPL